MHSGHRELVFLGVIEVVTTCFYGLILVHVVCRTYFGVRYLQGCAMNDVSDNEQVTDAINGMSRCVANGGESDDLSGQCIAKCKQMQAVVVGIHGLCGRAVARFHIEPCFILDFRGIQLGVGENNRVAAHQSTDVVSVEMGQIDVLTSSGDIPKLFRRGSSWL